MHRYDGYPWPVSMFGVKKCVPEMVQKEKVFRQQKVHPHLSPSFSTNANKKFWGGERNLCFKGEGRRVSAALVMPLDALMMKCWKHRSCVVWNSHCWFQWNLLLFCCSEHAQMPNPSIHPCLVYISVLACLSKDLSRGRRSVVATGIVMVPGQVVADEDEEREKPAEETCDFCPPSQLGIFSETSM